ncbi:cyclic GMP-AMP phosphodiesterase SMPDL3A isoform X2 [Planococcus citri]|uniref:cyclic GMP-AMP phosphodiesterase SMPDL3A isoform X2 n=1 Tax=Planococcus citri TaxID=170843 RepID=UPI0031F8FD4B
MCCYGTTLELLLVLTVLCIVAECKTAYFWHITDFHLDLTYEPADGSCHYKYGEGGKSTYGDYGCDASWALVESALQFMKKKRGDNVEYVIWSGDSIANISTLKTIDALAKTTSLFKQFFSTFFVIPVVGHTDNPTSDPSMYKHITELWKLWLPSEALETFASGGYYSIEQKNRPTIVVLNTNYMASNKDPLNQWKWLEHVLREVRRKKSTVFLFGHMPPGFVEPGREFLPKCMMSDENNARYLRMIENNADIISAQFFGHLHADTFRVFYNDTGKPISFGFVTPSISPREYNNPGFRLYKFDDSTGKIYDYEQYYLDLRTANSKKYADWVREYEFCSYYKIKSVTANELHDLAVSLTRANGSPLFEQYLDAYSVKSTKQDCTSNTSWYHYCAITKLNKQSFHQCLTESKKNQLECPQSHAIVIPQPSRGLQSSSVDQLIINMQILVAAFVFVFFSSQ